MLIWHIPLFFFWWWFVSSSMWDYVLGLCATSAACYLVTGAPDSHSLKSKKRRLLSLLPLHYLNITPEYNQPLHLAFEKFHEQKINKFRQNDLG